MYSLKQILENNNFETIEIFQHLTTAHRYLGELKGKCETIPNQVILLNTLLLQEAQDSSQIENIITTQDDLFKYRLNHNYKNVAAKEVSQYGEALSLLFEDSNKHKLITINMISKAQETIKDNNAGIRKQSGTVLHNEQTGEIIYTPPLPQEIPKLLQELEQFINNGFAKELDVIIKMAIIHHQFESIHPFYDGNGRIGRIINIVYLVKEGLLDLPILYLSRYINHNKSDYYYLLQAVRDDNNNWQKWLLFIIKGVIKTAQDTIKTIEQIKKLQQEYKQIIRAKHSNIYSQDLINSLFKHPYTKIAFLQQDLKVSRPTASRYLKKLNDNGLLVKYKLGRENYYINSRLIAILNQTKNLKNG
ncbi:MAG: Fic family protein [Methylococcales symbiont of Iophon sp. n. MRB-2018]|nr:MAG: Fic family protein [Methylococcales symbiont of Iophon sp. n. MRB-2018]KAF3978889.1 MAG: Fic family protein [Methylococcales symbiont of Iophon sp. n. MRB-2018]